MSASAKGLFTAKGALVAAAFLPLVLGIVYPFLSLPSAVARGSGASLGVVATVLVPMGTWAAARLASRVDVTALRA